MATDVSNSGWGGLILSPISKSVLDYWVGKECNWDIGTKEATAIHRMLSNGESLHDIHVDVHVDNQSVIQASSGTQQNVFHHPRYECCVYTSFTFLRRTTWLIYHYIVYHISTAT